MAVTQPAVRTISGGVAVTDPSGAGIVQWSPDGRHLLVSGDTSVELFDNAGTVLAQIDEVVAATWIDSNTYASATACASGLFIGEVTIHRLDGSATLLAGLFDSTMVMGSRHGALGLVPTSLATPIDGQIPSFVVWANGRLSVSVSGLPLAWSPDGSKLFVFRDATGASAARAELRAYPGLAVAVSFGPILIDARERPVFSADGRLLAIQCVESAAKAPCTQIVLDSTNGGRSVVTPGQAEGLPMSWLSNGHLLLQPDNTPTAGTFHEWDGARVVPSKLPAGSWAVASPDGRLVAIGTSPDAASGSTLVVTAGGARVTQLPSTGAACGWVTWSPDGTYLAVWDDAQQELDLVRVAA